MNKIIFILLTPFFLFSYDALLYRYDPGYSKWYVLEKITVPSDVACSECKVHFGNYCAYVGDDNNLYFINDTFKKLKVSSGVDKILSNVEDMICYKTTTNDINCTIYKESKGTTFNLDEKINIKDYPSSIKGNFN